MIASQINTLLWITTPPLQSQVLSALQEAFPRLTTHLPDNQHTIQPLVIRESLQAAIVEVDANSRADAAVVSNLARYAPDCPIFLVSTEPHAETQHLLPESSLVFGPLAPAALPAQIRAWLMQKSAALELSGSALRTHCDQVKAALVESRRNLGTLMRNLPGMAYRCRNTPDWIMEFVSEGCRELTGYPPEAILNSQSIAYGDLIHPEDRTLVWQNVQVGLKEQRPFHLIYRLIHASGQIRWVWERGCGVYDAATGELLALEGLILDFTAQQLAENQIRLQAMALAATDAGISISNQDNIVLWINPAFTRLTGYTAQEIIGNPIEKLRSNAHPESFYQELEQRIRAGQVWHGEIVNQRKDNTLYYEEQTITPVSNARGEITHFVSVRQDISERREHLRALQESEERYRTLFEQAQEAIFIEDAHDRIIDVNQRACDLMGYTREELLALTVADLQAPECRGRPGVIIQTELTQHQNHPFESVNLRKDGTHVPVEITNTHLRYEGRALILSIVRDISERKHAEALLAQEKERLELLHRLSEHLSGSLDMHSIAQMALRDLCTAFKAQEGLIFIPDVSESRYLDIIASTRWNVETIRDASRIMQMKIGVGLAGWVAEHHRPALVADVTQDPRWYTFPGLDDWVRGALSVPLIGGETLIGVLSLYSPEPDFFNAEHLWLAESAAAPIAVAINNARLFKALSQHSERLEQRVAERTSELQAQYARLDAVLRSITDGVIVTDAEGQILQLNPIAQNWLRQTLTPEDAEQLRQAIRELACDAAARPERVLELQGVDLELRAAPILESATATPLAAFPQASIVVAVHDVSHLKALDRMKSHFVSNVSHELRTPVATIQAYTQLLRHSPPEKVTEYLNALETEAKYQTRLIEDILQFSRLDAGRLELQCQHLDLNGLVKTTTASFQPLAIQKSIRLQVFPAERPLSVWADQTKIQQVLNNLIINALQYTPPEGQVTVTLTEGYLKDRHTATIRVQDTGMGIPEEELPHVFERFFRGNQPRNLQIPGTGLGLAITREIVALHGGWVAMESAVGKGTTVTVHLPLNPPAEG